MPQIQINHLAIVVEDLEESLSFWRDALGLPLGEIKEVQEEDVKIAFLEAGNAHIELLTPTTDDSGVAKYLAKKGQGMHHICLEVEDVEASLQVLSERGIELINETPRVRDGKSYAFVHPRRTGGVLVELYEVET